MLWVLARDASVLAGFVVALLASWFALLRRAQPREKNASLALKSVFASFVSLYLLVLCCGALLGDLSRWLFVALYFGHLVALRLLTRRLPRPPIATRDVRPLNAGVRVLAALFGLVFCAFSLYALVFPPTGYDDYGYHLPFIEMALQHNRLEVFPFPAEWGMLFYPKAVELLMLVPGLLFHKLQLALWPNLIFFASIPLLVIAFGDELGFDPASTLVAALAAAFVPSAILAISTAMIDLAYAISLVIAVYFATIVIFRRDHSWIDLTFYAASVGFLPAIKGTGIVHGPVLALLVAATAFIVARQPDIRPWPRVWELLASCLGAFVLLGAFWYARNFAAFGNPIYPLALDFLGLHLPGHYQVDELFPASEVGEFAHWSRLRQLAHNWRETEGWSGVFYHADGRFNGMGPLWSTLFLPSSVWGIFAALLRREARVTFVLLLGWALFALAPFNFYARYTFFLAFFGAVGFAFMLGQVSPRAKTALGVITMALCAFVALSCLPNAIIYPTTVRKQLAAMYRDRPSEVTLSFKLDRLKHYVTEHAAGAHIGFDDQIFFSALRDLNQTTRIFYIDAPARADLPRFIAEHRLDYVLADLDSDFGKSLLDQPARFSLALEEKNVLRSGLFSIRREGTQDPPDSVRPSKPETFELVGDVELRSSHGNRIAIVPDAVRGYVDSAARDSVEAGVSGWAVDVAKKLPVERVVVFADEKYGFVASPTFERPGIVDMFHTPEVLRCGWAARFPAPKRPDLIRAFGVSGDRATELVVLDSARDALALKP